MQYFVNCTQSPVFIYVMRCAIWYNLYNLKNLKNTHGGVLKPATLLKVTLLQGCFSSFSNCVNGTKSRKAFHMYGHLRGVKLPEMLCASFRTNVSIGFTQSNFSFFRDRLQISILIVSEFKRSNSP